MFSAFNPSKCTHLATDCAAPGEQSWTSCRSRDSNPQPWVTSGFKSNALSIRPTTAHSPDTKPLTRCGILSTVNSLYDPLGFAEPVTIHGRFLLRELSKGIDDCDEPLPEDKCREWEMWRNSLQDLERIHVQRTYSLKSLSRAKSTELCIFSDASFKAIGAVAYLKTTHEDGQISVGFILGKAKLTALDKPTIPRLELC